MIPTDFEILPAICQNDICGFRDRYSSKLTPRKEPFLTRIILRPLISIFNSNSSFLCLGSKSGQYKMQTADCSLQLGFKMQTRYKMQTADRVENAD